MIAQKMIFPIIVVFFGWSIAIIAVIPPWSLAVDDASIIGVCHWNSVVHITLVALHIGLLLSLLAGDKEKEHEQGG